MNTEITLVRALAAAARAFADEIDRGLPPDPLTATAPPAPGSAQSMLEVLRSVAHINLQEHRGASDEEIRAIARRAGMDPRGMAGYYAANLLEKRRGDGTRWVSQAGRERLLALTGAVLLDAPTHQPPSFDALYAADAAAPPPWDIGRPQPAFLHLAESGALRGRVLDIGCGTGEHALMAANLGLPTTGIDAAPTAIGLAKKKAAQRGLEVRFLVWDALELPTLGEQFDTVLDCGLFHVFDDADRARYVASLRAIVAPRGQYVMLCFSDRMPGTGGPRRVSQDEIRTSFGDGWQIESVEPATLEVTLPNHPPATLEVTLPMGAALAWLAVITRVADDRKMAVAG